MKKILITALLTSLIAGAAFADNSNVVSSANIVGYVQTELPPSGHLVLVGSSFDGTNDNPTLISIFGTNQLTQSFIPGLCDQVYLWDTQTQEYISVAQKSADHNFYYLTNWTGNTCNDLDIPLGSALWVKSFGSSISTNTLSISGDVPMYGSITNIVSGDAGRPLAFICNPYPTAKNINDLINTSDGATASFIPALADAIYLWDKGNQAYVSIGLKNSDNMWHYATNWSGAAVSIDVEVGEGFWYGALNTFSWIETKDF